VKIGCWTDPLKFPETKNNSFCAALRFLTILPVPGDAGVTQEALAGALPYFPLVGLCLGGMAYLLAMVFGYLFEPLLASVLMAAALMAFSGGLHLDGLADTADGFFSSRPRAKILEIMRDSRIGVMGVIWVVVVFMLKVTALSGMSSAKAGICLFLMPIAGRSLMLVMMALLPYVRGNSGLASLFYNKAGGARAWWAVIFLMFISWLIAALPGLMAAIGALFLVLLFCYYCRTKIGGATGDTLGAACELAETAVAVVLAMKMFA